MGIERWSLCPQGSTTEGWSAVTTQGEEVHIEVGEQEFRGRASGSRAARDFFHFLHSGVFNRSAGDKPLWEQLGGCTIQTVSRKCCWSEGQSGHPAALSSQAHLAILDRSIIEINNSEKQRREIYLFSVAALGRGTNKEVQLHSPNVSLDLKRAEGISR